jgi:heterodisulfide reductase subunit A
VCQRFSDVNVFDLFQDIRTYGRGHEDYYEGASKRGVLFVRYLAEVPPIVARTESSNGSPLVVQVKDSLTFGEELEIPADLIVLSTGMVPSKIDKLVEELKLPRGADGFLQEVHPKLRPVETAVKGVLVAGTCQAPMDITESCASGGAAAVKAAAILANGHIELDPFVAQVNPDLCEGEGLCVQECSYQQAISLVEHEPAGRKEQQAEVNAALCTGCGMCVAVCPHRAIQLAGWQLDQFDAMVDAIVADDL